MGVRTVVWGRYGWMVLDGLCHALDTRAGTTLANAENTSYIRQHAIVFLRSLAYAWPCVHCRISYGRFVEAATAPNTDTVLSAERIGTMRFSVWVWAVHNAVNRKLGKPLMAWKDKPEPQPRFESPAWVSALLWLASYVQGDADHAGRKLVDSFWFHAWKLMSLLRHPFVDFVEAREPDLLARQQLSVRAAQSQTSHQSTGWSMKQRLAMLEPWRRLWADWAKLTSTGERALAAGPPVWLSAWLGAVQRAVVGCKPSDTGCV